MINTDFTANGTINDARCYNDSNGSITVNISGGSPPFKYLWSTGDSSSTISGLDTGIYILHITELTKQCNLIDSFIIAQPDTINIVAEIKEDICRQGKGSIFTTITGGTPTYNYSWSNLSVGPNIENLVTGNYLLSVTDKNGCNKKTAFNVPDTCNDIIIYNAVSPNGDGINDTWIIIGLQLYPNNTVQVFDKWGDEVFSASNYQNDWAGTGKNGLLPDGTYYYLVKPNTPGAPDVKESYTGSLLIKR